MQTETRSNLTALEVHVHLTWVPSSGVGHCGAQDKRVRNLSLIHLVERKIFLQSRKTQNFPGSTRTSMFWGKKPP
jgi:hypothetical protein